MVAVFAFFCCKFEIARNWIIRSFIHVISEVIAASAVYIINGFKLSIRSKVKFRNEAYLFLCGEDVLALLAFDAALDALLVLFEVFVVQMLWQFEVAQIQLSGCADHVTLRDAAERARVELKTKKYWSDAFIAVTVRIGNCEILPSAIFKRRWRGGLPQAEFDGEHDQSKIPIISLGFGSV